MTAMPTSNRFRKPSVMAALALAGFGLAATSPASAAGGGPLRMPAENWTIPYSADASAIPTCADPGVTSKISSRFATAESSYWNSTLQIVSFANLRPIAFRPWGLDFIPRLYCSGTVVTSDGRKRAITYHIGQDTGIIGYGWGVEYCVEGLDRQRSFAAGCKQAGP